MQYYLFEMFHTDTDVRDNCEIEESIQAYQLGKDEILDDNIMGHEMGLITRPTRIVHCH